MTSAPNSPTADDLRRGYLPRMYPGRSALQRMLIRLASYRDAAARAADAEPQFRVFRMIDALYRLHTLAENLLQIYELMAEHVDIRDEGRRKGLQSRISERTDKGRTRFQKKIWVYTLFKHITDSEFTRRGLDPATARTTLDHLAARSVAHLDVADETLRRFHAKYEPFSVAHKHGRAVFGMEARLEETAPGTGTVSFHATTTVATIVQADSNGSAECLSLVADDELGNDMAEAYGIIEEQVPRLYDMLRAITTAAEQALDFVEGRRTERRLETQSFHFFAAPYSDDELHFLRALQGGSAIEFE